MTLSPLDWPGALEALYLVGFALSWRVLTGHMAWSVHRSATEHSTLRPPLENWLCCAVPCFFLSLIWFVVVWFALPWPRRLQAGAEREAEAELRGLRLERLTLENERIMRLDRGDPLSGEVVDDDDV